MILSTIYRAGLNASSFRQALRRQVTIKHSQPGQPKDVAGRVAALERAREQLVLDMDKYGHTSEYSFARDIAEIRSRNDQIVHLESLVDDAMVEGLIETRVVGLGYRSRDDSEPLIVCPHEWAFLTVDCANNCARFEDGSGYCALRFVWPIDLSDDQLAVVKEAFVSCSNPNRGQGGLKPEPFSELRRSADEPSAPTEGKSGRIGSSEEARELARKKYARRDQALEKLRRDAEQYIRRGRMNHSQIATELFARGGYMPLKLPAVRNAIKEQCREMGETHLILGHPDYRKSS